MAFGFLIIGILAIITSVRGTQSQVATQLGQDFTSTGSGPSFWLWIGLILVMVVIGKTFGLEKSSRVFIMLIIVVYLISQNGVFGKFETAITTVQAPAAASTAVVGADATATTTGAPATTSSATPAAATTTTPSAPASWLSMFPVLNSIFGAATPATTSGTAQ